VKRLVRRQRRCEKTQSTFRSAWRRWYESARVRCRAPTPPGSRRTPPSRGAPTDRDRRCTTSRQTTLSAARRDTAPPASGSSQQRRPCASPTAGSQEHDGETDRRSSHTQAFRLRALYSRTAAMVARPTSISASPGSEPVM
jgi:hypothetical protein